MRARDLVLPALLVLAAAGALVSFASYLDTPIVQQSAVDGRCVRVLDPAAERERRRPATCDRLPDSYEPQIVER